MSVFTHILAQTKIAFALVNNKQEVEEHNEAFQNVCNIKGRLSKKTIQELIPKFIGLEEKFKKIASGKLAAFNLPYLNKNQNTYTLCDRTLQ